MTALSIRHMNFTLQRMELEEANRAMKAYESRPADSPISHYWFIERKAKHGRNKWIHVRDYVGTKQEVALFFCKYFRDGNHRLTHQLTYGMFGQ